MLNMERCWWLTAISWLNQLWNAASLLDQCRSPPSASVSSCQILSAPPASIGFMLTQSPSSALSVCVYSIILWDFLHLSPWLKGPWKRSSVSQKHPALSDNLLGPSDQGMLIHNSTVFLLSTQPINRITSNFLLQLYYRTCASIHWSIPLALFDHPSIRRSIRPWTVRLFICDTIQFFIG